MSRVQAHDREGVADSGTGMALQVVWDVPVRLVHWALVGCLAFSWYSAEQGLMDWHRRSGYAVLALLLFRILWGLVGSSTARFANFLKGPSVIWNYSRTLGARQRSDSVGHNPLGALSVVALLLLLAAQVGTGLFAVDIDGIESGPLSDRVSFDTGRWLAGLHELSFTALQIIVALHICAVLFYLFYKRDNLIGPMITGKRRAARTGLRRVSPLRLAAAVLVAGAATWFISQGLRL